MTAAGRVASTWKQIMQQADSSSTGVCKDLPRWDQKDQLPHAVSSWKPGNPDRKLSAICLPLDMKISTACPLQLIPSVHNHTEARRSLVLYIFTVNKEPLQRGSTARQAKKHCHHFYTLPCPERWCTQALLQLLQEKYMRSEKPYLGAPLSVLSWLQFWLTASFFPFCLMPSEPTTSGKKKNQVSHESKCSLTYQHTQANRRENQWAQYSLDLYRETKCPTDFLFVIWSTHRILTELFGGDAASPAEEGLTPACHTATENSRAAGALSELIISSSFLKQDGKCKERKKND